MATKRQFGRLVSVDKRDRKYLLPRGKSDRQFRYWWANGWWGNQGYTPQCVAYAWTHWLEDGPITHNQVKPPMIKPAVLYKEAQQNDEWPGEDYDGTSVRGAAIALKNRGLVTEYRWAFSIDRVIYTLLEVGPLVVGTEWYSGMLDTDKDGLIYVIGDVEGGHGYVLNGINMKKDLIRVKNSWGRNWGVNGYAWISIPDFKTLLQNDGECCLAVEAEDPKGQSLKRRRRRA